MEAKNELSRHFTNDEDAYQALLAVEEIAFSAPESAARVIHKATRPFEGFSEYWQGKDFKEGK